MVSCASFKTVVQKKSRKRDGSDSSPFLQLWISVLFSQARVKLVRRTEDSWIQDVAQPFCVPTHSPGPLL